MNKIDFEFICRTLGDRCIDVRGPSQSRPRAGVEIGNSLSLAGMKPSDLRSLSIPESLKRKLTPYVGKTGAELTASWRWQPLRLSTSERASLMKIDAQRQLRALNARYMSAASNARRRSLGSLPQAAQTTLFLLDWQTAGRTEHRLPHVWAACCRQDWTQARQAVARSPGLTGKSAIASLLGRMA